MAGISWNARVKADRTITDDEKLDLLPKQRNDYVEATDRGSLLQFNSTYTEYVDPRFFIRGSLASLGALGGVLFSLYCVFVINYYAFPSNDYFVKSVAIISTCIAFLFMLLFFLSVIKYDFFTYTAYPVRFNRKNRKIYVFRPPKEGGVQVFSWDEVNFYINRVKNHPHRHLIGHVMDGDFIKFSFVVGMAHVEDEVIKELWEFVYRYMEEGPKSVKPPFIAMTITPSIVNHYRMSYTRAAITNYFFVVLFFPIIGPLIALRWIIFKTCKSPVWPEWVEVECVVAANDPHHLPEPKYIGDGFEEHPEFLQKVVEKDRRERANKRGR